MKSYKLLIRSLVVKLVISKPRHERVKENNLYVIAFVMCKVHTERRQRVVRLRSCPILDNQNLEWTKLAATCVALLALSILSLFTYYHCRFKQEMIIRTASKILIFVRSVTNSLSFTRF